eukprot:20285-Pleurochrysis_carterae.AAC.2
MALRNKTGKEANESNSTLSIGKTIKQGGRGRETREPVDGRTNVQTGREQESSTQTESRHRAEEAQYKDQRGLTESARRTVRKEDA